MRRRHLSPVSCGCQVALDARFGISVADGQPIDTWNGRPGSSINATASGANRPTFRASSINGRPAVEFDGVDDLFSLGASGQALLNNVASVMILGVFVIDGVGDATQNAVHFSVNASAGNSRATLVVRNSSANSHRTVGRRVDADAATNSSSITGTDTPSILQSIVDYGTGVVGAMRNGVAPANGTLPSTGTSPATNSFTATIGATSVTTQRQDGRTAAVIVAVPCPPIHIRMMLRQSLGLSYRIPTH